VLILEGQWVARRPFGSDPHAKSAQWETHSTFVLPNALTSQENQSGSLQIRKRKTRGDYMRATKLIWGLALITMSVTAGDVAAAQSMPTSAAPERIIIDTDIGGDIDDAFAIALALQSPDLRILGISTASGDTTARAKIVDEMLGQSDHKDIPVVVGNPNNLRFSSQYIGRQGRFGEMGRFAKATHPPAVDFISDQINSFPNQITLVTMGPLTNVAALIDKDPQAVKRLKRIVMMGGSIATAYNEGINHAVPEYNIFADIPAAQKVFQSGVPIYVMPLDSTLQLKLDEVKRAALFYEGTPLTDSLAILYLMANIVTPVLYDAMPIAFIVDPKLCAVQPMHIVVDEKGITRSEPGAPNSQVCLHSDLEAFFHLYMSRLASP
jgi:purine nucleosidase